MNATSYVFSFLYNNLVDDFYVIFQNEIWFEELFLGFYVNCSAVSPFQITGGSFLYRYM